MSGRRKADKKRFRKLSTADKAIVFYAENGDSWPHYQPIVNALAARGRSVVYVTSDDQDPVLDSESSSLIPIVTDDGLARALMFQTLEAGVVVMTVPGLDTGQIKRSRAKSPFHPHYVHVFHSMVSAHMIYEPAAFDHYDTVFCVGPHHRSEIRAMESAWNLKEKKLIDHGYGRLDDMLESTPPAAAGGRPTVIVAPSWGPHGVIEVSGVETVKALLETGLDVIVRPHPMTKRNTPEAVARLEAFCADEPRARIDTDIRSVDALYDAHAMVSDWSGVALEYAFALGRPVVFVDLPRKVNDERYLELGIDPIEITIREEIGSVIDPSNLSSIGSLVQALIADSTTVTTEIEKVRRRTVYNLGRSGEVGAEYIADLADRYLRAI